MTVALWPGATTGGLKLTVGGTWGIGWPLKSKRARPTKSSVDAVVVPVVAEMSATAKTQVPNPALISAWEGGHWAFGSGANTVGGEPAMVPPELKVPAPFVPRVEGWV